MGGLCFLCPFLVLERGWLDWGLYDAEKRNKSRLLAITDADRRVQKRSID